MDDHDDLLVGVSLGNSVDTSLNPSAELRRRLGTWNDIPTLFGEHLHGDRVRLAGVLAERRTLPVAEVDLAQVRLDLGRNPQQVGERCRRLRRTTQGRHVDRGNRLVSQPRGKSLGLVDAHRVQIRIGMAVGEIVRLVLASRRRLAVPNDQQVTSACRWGKSVLPILGRFRIGCCWHVVNGTLETETYSKGTT